MDCQCSALQHNGKQAAAGYCFKQFAKVGSRIKNDFAFTRYIYKRKQRPADEIIPALSGTLYTSGIILSACTQSHETPQDDDAADPTEPLQPLRDVPAAEDP